MQYDPSLIRSLRPRGEIDLNAAQRLSRYYRKTQQDDIGQPIPTARVTSQVTSTTPSIMPAEVFRPEHMQQLVSPLASVVLDRKGRAQMRAGDLRAALGAPVVAMNNSIRTGADFLAVRDMQDESVYRPMKKTASAEQTSVAMTTAMVFGLGLGLLLLIDYVS